MSTALDRKIDKAEMDLFKRKDALVKLLKKRGPEKVSDYTFAGWDGKPVKLSQLFGTKKDLILVHNMGHFCPYCTLWADEINGVRHHLENRAALVVANNDDLATQKKFAKGRGWKFRMVSAKGTPFFHDMGFEPKPMQFWPGVSTFRKSGKSLQRVAHRFFGPGDDFCGVWHFLELLGKGADGWQPRFQY